MCAPRPGLIQPGAAIQLSKKDKKAKQTKTPKTTKSGKLTKREQQKQEDRQKREAEQAAKEKETAERRVWQEKARLGTKKEMAKEWEENKEIFDQWMRGNSATPPNATAPRYPIPIVDLRDIRQDNPYLARLIEDSLQKIEIRPNTPEHGNIEGRFPVYDRDATPLAYFEFSFLGGGGRMVVDTIAGIVYISMHYKYNYQLLDCGRPPGHAVDLARLQRTSTMRFLAMQHEEAVVIHLDRESPRVERASPRMHRGPMSPEDLAESVVAHVLDDDSAHTTTTTTTPSPPIRTPLRPLASYELWSLYGSGAAIWGHDLTPPRR
jgi:hypothetical protein